MDSRTVIAHKRIAAGEDVEKVIEDLKYSPRSASRLRRFARERVEDTHARAGFETSVLPTPERSVEEIFAAKAKKFARVQNHYESSGSHSVKINIPGPIAIANFGDPHLDDDGCNIALFREHVELVKRTEGLFAGNIGDVLNNWVGRLTAKYADQTTTQAEAWSLFEWMVREIPWLYLVYGNHDCWPGGNNPGTFILKALGQTYINHGTRIRLNFPGGEHMMLNVAHDYKGHSEVNSVHGAMKKGLRFADDLYICGHRHHTAMSMFMHPKTNAPIWSIRLDSYKQYDDYPGKLGIDETFGSPCIVTILNPYASNPLKRVMPFLDPHEGAAYLTWLRQREPGVC